MTTQDKLTQALRELDVVTTAIAHEDELRALTRLQRLELLLKELLAEQALQGLTEHAEAHGLYEAEHALAAEPGPYLLNGARFKVYSGWGLPPELTGRWVALVAADDDCHLSAHPVQEPAQAAVPSDERAAFDQIVTTLRLAMDAANFYGDKRPEIIGYFCNGLNELGTQPVREPMTDAQLQDLMPEPTILGTGGVYRHWRQSDLLWFARAIERHHGITKDESHPVCSNCGEAPPGCGGLFASDGKACEFHGITKEGAAK